MGWGSKKWLKGSIAAVLFLDLVTGYLGSVQFLKIHWAIHLMMIWLYFNKKILKKLITFEANSTIYKPENWIYSRDTPIGTNSTVHFLAGKDSLLNEMVKPQLLLYHYSTAQLLHCFPALYTLWPNPSFLSF